MSEFLRVYEFKAKSGGTLTVRETPDRVGVVVSVDAAMIHLTREQWRDLQGLDYHELDVRGVDAEQAA